ncbi:MFS transporter [Paludibacterium yongneupense]|uniref:MFS transporter n=1 Tax=Paludibacterium yongneupense TaxID=400061 RepID=UPI000686E127|nr:MFS transporter [Paludibacterium yongneupense]
MTLLRTRHRSAQPGQGSAGKIFSCVFFSFICYLTIGIPLAILPGYVNVQLGYDAVLAGLAISVQYVATVLSRPHAGRMTDVLGPKRTVLYGLFACAGSGVATFAAALSVATPVLALSSLIAGRLLLGVGESMVATGAIMWGIGRVGAGQTARVISWNGVSTYSALAIGAPLGVLLEQHGGLAATGLLVAVLALATVALAWRQPGVAIVAGARMPFRRLLRRVSPYGLGLALGGTGFGVIATFITLYFAHEHWSGAAMTLSLFGAGFIGVRLSCAGAINRFGGFRVAIVSFLVEAIGLALLWLAGGSALAFVGAALTGIGFSLVFPALAVEAVRGVPSQNRGTALGAYSVFVDFSLGMTGPLAGAIINGFGYRAMFLSSCGGVVFALLLSVWLSSRARGAIAA